MKMKKLRVFEYDSYDANGSNILVRLDENQIREEYLKNGRWPRLATFEDCLLQWLGEHSARESFVNE